MKRGKDAMNVMKHMQLLLKKDKVLPPFPPRFPLACQPGRPEIPYCEVAPVIEGITGDASGAKQAHRTQGEARERHAGARKCALCITVRRSTTTRKFKVRPPRPSSRVRLRVCSLTHRLLRVCPTSG